MTASPCQEGAPFPLGSSWDAESQSYNFALYSKHAQRVILLFFGADDFHSPLEQFELDDLVSYDEKDSDLYVMINLGPDDLDFAIHEGQPTDWKQAINTTKSSASECSIPSPFFDVPSRAIIVLERIQMSH